MLLRATGSESVSPEAMLRAQAIGDQLSEFVCERANPIVAREAPLVLPLIRPVETSASSIETLDALHGLYSGGARWYTEMTASNRPSYIHWAGRIAGHVFYVAERYIGDNSQDSNGYSKLETAYAMTAPPKLLHDQIPTPRSASDRDISNTLSSRVVNWLLTHPIYT